MTLCCWFDISSLIIYAHRRITDDKMDSFLEELKWVFDKFLKYDVKIMIWDKSKVKLSL
jgi:hypothetical protein